MKVHGRDIGFRKTVGAVCWLEEQCPEKNLKNLNALLTYETYMQKFNAYATIIIAMNTGYEEEKAFFEDGYKPNPVTKEELKTLDQETLLGLFTEAVSVFYENDQTVEVEEPKKKEEINETSD